MNIQNSNNDVVRIINMIILLIQVMLFIWFKNFDILWGLNSLTFINIVFSLNFILGLVRKKKIVSALFLSLVLDVLIVIFLKYVIIKTDITSWRALFINKENKYLGLYYLNQSILILKIGYVFFYDFNVKNACISHKRFDNLALLPNIVIVFFLLVNVFFVAIEGSVILAGRSAWLTGRTSIPWIEIFYLNLLVSIILFHVYKVRSFFSSLLYFVNISITAYLALTGFRGILVFYAFCIITIILLNKQQITKNETGKFVLLALAGIVLLNALSLIRSDIKVEDDFLSVFSEQFGLHEENIFTSFVGTMDYVHDNKSITYIDSVLEIAPKFLRSESIQHIRVNNLIGSIFFSDEQLNAGHNVGAFYLTEGVFNWKVYGVFSSTLIFLIITVLTEQIIKRNSNLRVSLYLIMSGNIYIGVYYGSATFVKMIFYEIILIVLIDLILKFEKAQNN